VYLPRPFVQDDPAAVRELLRRSPLADLVSWSGSGFEVSTIPLLLDPSVGSQGALVGHVARANGHWRSLASSPSSGAGAALAIFRGPDAYISPATYASKARDPRLVPTWNYLAVHVHGPVVVHDDASWKEALVRRLTEEHEAGRPDPWSVDDAPTDFVAGQLRAIVGIELVIERIEAKWKVSQNRLLEDAASAAAALAASPVDSERAMAAEMRTALAQRPPDG
jgi:transcriptional regulator